MINVNMTDKAGVTLATAGKYCADNVKVTPSAEILRKDEQAKTATPTTSAQDITPDVGKALSKVTVNPITAAIVGDLDAYSFAPAIVAAVEGKGVTVPDGTLLDGMASLIEAIQAGGSENQLVYGTYTPASDQTVAYGGSFSVEFGFVPDVFVMYQLDSSINFVKNSAAIIIDHPYAHGQTGNKTLFLSIVTAPTSVSTIGTSNHRYFSNDNVLTETKVNFYGPSGSLLVGGIEYFWIAAKFT